LLRRRAGRRAPDRGLILKLRGSRVVLRPLRIDELDAIAEAQARLYSFVEESAPTVKRRLRKRIEHSGRLVDGWLDLGIEAEGRLVGDITARNPKNAFPPGVFEVGISVFDEADRGKGYGREAMELITTHLFELGAGRVQATTSVDNLAMRRVLENLGFAHEGTLRGFMPGHNGREDYVLYAVTSGEWRPSASRA
jgi:RimJ/RimL family protein N-acetyltransferase